MSETTKTDYRVILKTALERYVAEKGLTLKKEIAIELQMSPSLMVRVIHLKRNIPVATIDRIFELSILNDEEKELFMRDYIAQMLPAHSIQKFIRNECKSCSRDT